MMNPCYIATNDMWNLDVATYDNAKSLKTLIVVVACVSRRNHSCQKQWADCLGNWAVADEEGVYCKLSSWENKRTRPCGRKPRH